MRVGTLVIHRGYFGIGVVTKVKFMTNDNGKQRYVLVHWLGDTQTSGWLRANNNGMEVICE